MSATGTPSAPCLRMNAFCASENCDAFIVFRSSQPGENTAENSSFERSSFQGADHELNMPPSLDRGGAGKFRFIFRAAGRDCRAGDEAPSAFCRRSSYADERRYSLYAKLRIFAA